MILLGIQWKSTLRSSGRLLKAVLISSSRGTSMRMDMGRRKTWLKTLILLLDFIIHF
jgi:hypothetical protein